MKLLFLAAILCASLGVAFATEAVRQSEVVVSLAVTPAQSSVDTGATEQMKVTITMSDNSTVDGTNMVMWSVAPDSVAVVNPAGLLTARSAGTATIMAVYNSIPGTAKVTVK